MTPFSVTKASNVKENGDFIDEEAMGVVVEVSTLTYTYTKSHADGSQTIETGLISRAVTLWDNDRTPKMEDLNDLIWLELLDGSGDEESESEEDEDEDEDLDFDDTEAATEMVL